jgi:hypothetical protein
VQIAHSATRPIDHPTTEYSICATIPGPTPSMILVVARHAAPATCTLRDKQT